MAVELAALATSYTGLVVTRRRFDPRQLPTFDRYAIVLSPSSRPWEEQRHGPGNVNYLFRVDVYLLVKDWGDSDASLFGVAAGSRGLFQLVEDVKDLLRLSNLNGLLDKTYDEPGGDARALGGGGVEFGETAAPGFESGEFTFVWRVRIPYVARTVPFCHVRL